MVQHRYGLSESQPGGSRRREFGFLETRLRLDRATVAGHSADPVVAGRVADRMRAACGWHESRQLRVARFGDSMRDMAVTEGDKLKAQIQFGVCVNSFAVTELVDAVDTASDEQVDNLVTEYKDAYEMTPTCVAAASGTPRCAMPHGWRSA